MTSSQEGKIEGGAEALLGRRAEIEAALADAGRPPVALGVSGLDNFSPAELGRLGEATTAAQIERVLGLVRDLRERFPGRLRVVLGERFTLFTPATTLEDLRINANAFRRLGVDPAPVLAAAARQTHRFEDERAARVHQRLGEATPGANLGEVFEEAMDEAAGIARGKKLRPLRMVRAPRDRDDRPAQGTVQIALNRACNQGCGFCSVRGADVEPPRARAARAIHAVREAAKGSLRTLLVSGAEPTLEWYLPDLIRLARDLGIPEVALETNATLLGEEDRAVELATAGLGRAVVACNALDPAVADRISRDPGGLGKTEAGIRALLRAGVAVELAVALLPENRGALADLVERARAVFPGERARVEAVVARYVARGPSLAAPLDLRAAAAELTAASRASQRSGLPLRTAPGGELPPCLFDDPVAARSVLRLGTVLVERAGDRFRRLPACDACAVRAACPGALAEIADRAAPLARPLSAEAAAPLLPVSEERARVLSEFKSRFLLEAPSGEVRERRIVRVNFHCNQACDFCFVSRELPQVEDALVEQEIAEAARANAILDLSGGEPTLNERLPDYLRLARSLGVRHLELQTNAVKMSDAAYARELAEAGLTQAFVSLHGITPAVCDRVTAAPGTFVKTVAGIKNLVENGVGVVCNFVLCGYNVEELAGLPAFVEREFRSLVPGARVNLNFSFVAASSDNVPRDTRLIPRFTDVAWALEAAHEATAARGIEMTGFDSKCGVPPCYLPEAIRKRHFAGEIPAEELKSAGSGFTKAEVCSTCELDKRCYGIRSSYAEMYGTGELRPIQGGKVRAAPVEDLGDPVWRALGLAPSHRLRPGSTAALGDDARFARLPETWADRAGGRVDLEIVQLEAGLRKVVKRERSSLAAAERTAADFERRGFVVRIAGSGTASPRFTVFIAREAALGEEAARIEPELSASFRDRAALVERMGALLGYPACCSAAFAASPDQDDATHIARLSRAQTGVLLPEQNWAAISIRPFSHFPCEPGCEATARLGRSTIERLAEGRPEMAAALRRALAGVTIVLAADRHVILGGARPDGPGTFRYESVLSHRSLGLDDEILGRRLFRAFYLEIVAPLEEGDAVSRAPGGGALLVERNGQPIGRIELAGGAPPLLDFTGAVEKRRLPMASAERSGA